MTAPRTRKLLTTQELAALVRQPAGTIRAWKGRGCPAMSRNGRLWFDPEKVAAWREEHGLDGTAGARKGSRHYARKRAAEASLFGEAPAETDARARWETARAQKLEIEVQRLRGELVAVSDVEEKMATLGRLLRAGLLAIPPRLAPVLAGMDGVPAVERRLRDELEEVIREFTEGAA